MPGNETSAPAATDAPYDGRHGNDTTQRRTDDAAFTDAQVRAVTVWKVEIGHMTAKVHARPPRPDRPRQ